MSTGALQRVWQPIRIGSVEIPNRVARAANTTSVFPTGVDEQFIAYHLARARGGVGLSILEAASVHDSSMLSYRIDDAVCRGYENLMRAVRPHGMRVFQQLWHGGHHIPGFGGRLPWAASDVPSPFTGLVGLPMGRAEIAEVVAAFATAARRCRDAGLDGVEVHGGHGYLIQQFLSPLTNTRDDEYGGSLENRMRFAIEVLTAVRAAVGPDYPVGIRLSTSTASGNLSSLDLAQLARRLEDLRSISFLDLSHGDYYAMDRMTATLADAAGYEIEPNRALLEAVKIPRMITGRFRTLEEIETVLRAGDADLVSMVRAQIADPDIVRKTREGRVDEIRPCIACNQGCVGGLLQVGRLGCAVNPAAGNEQQLDESQLTRAAHSRRVMVIGGGPAGLEAARVAALRGHSVVLAEAGPRLGGALCAAKRAPRLQGIADITDWLEREVYRLGVAVRTGSFVEADDVVAESPDHVIVATGATSRGSGVQASDPGRRPAGCDLPQVCDASELLQRSAEPLQGRTAVVFDDVGHYEAVAAAEHLVEGGATVVFVTSLPAFAPKMNGTFRHDVALKYLYRGRFSVRVGHRLAQITPKQCEIVPLRGEAVEIVAADLVVLVTHRAPARALYDQLRALGISAQLVGDAASPRTLQDAIREGHLAARGLPE